MRLCRSPARRIAFCLSWSKILYLKKKNRKSFKQNQSVSSTSKQTLVNFIAYYNRTIPSQFCKTFKDLSKATVLVAYQQSSI